MNIPEKAPPITELSLQKHTVTSDAIRYAAEYNRKYLHWDELKYREFGDSSRDDIWFCMKLLRNTIAKTFTIDSIDFSYVVNDRIMSMLYEIDMRVLSNITQSGKILSTLSVSSMMEESITSSQMEGASTTALLAKKILRTNAVPKDKSERMIVNNYHAMQFIKGNLDSPLKPELILKVHSIMTAGTLENVSDEGRFRTDNTIAVRGRYEDITYYEPVCHTKIRSMIISLCDFINDSKDVHPVVKGILLHFMIAYIHPFVDGNGRVARAMFYWFMLRSGYHYAEYLAISKVIKEHRQRYDLAYLLTETDGNDLTYFIDYNLGVILESINVLNRYIDRKTKEQGDVYDSLSGYGLTQRQMLLFDDIKKGTGPVSVYDMTQKYQISAASVRRDILRLVESGLVRPAGKDGHIQLYAAADSTR